MVSRSTSASNAPGVVTCLPALSLGVASRARRYDLAVVAHVATSRQQRTVLADHTALGRGSAAAGFESHAGFYPLVSRHVALRRLDSRVAVDRIVSDKTVLGRE